LGTLLATLNMCQFVLQRSRLLQQQQQASARGSAHKPANLPGSGDGVVSSSLGSRLLPKPSLGRAAAVGAAAGKALAGRPGVRTSAGGTRGASGFSMQAVLSAVGRGSDDAAEGLPPQPQQQQQQRPPGVIQPKSPSGAWHLLCRALPYTVVAVVIVVVVLAVQAAGTEMACTWHASVKARCRITAAGAMSNQCPPVLFPWRCGWGH
jgi:hypothetical protein